jgi:hypothetical protein
MNEGAVMFSIIKRFLLYNEWARLKASGVFEDEPITGEVAFVAEN